MILGEPVDPFALARSCVGSIRFHPPEKPVVLDAAVFSTARPPFRCLPHISQAKASAYWPEPKLRTHWSTSHLDRKIFGLALPLLFTFVLAQTRVLRVSYYKGGIRATQAGRRSWKKHRSISNPSRRLPHLEIGHCNWKNVPHAYLAMLI